MFNAMEESNEKAKFDSPMVLLQTSEKSVERCDHFMNMFYHGKEFQVKKVPKAQCAERILNRITKVINEIFKGLRGML